MDIRQPDGFKLHEFSGPCRQIGTNEEITQTFKITVNLTTKNDQKSGITGEQG